MNISKVKLHNFRSVKDADFNLEDYSILNGENNAGKSNIITAFRIFYEEQNIKFNESIDFPKFDTDDQESWIEIEFLTTDEEQAKLKESYRAEDNILRVRRYFKSAQYVKSNQSNIYGYENGILSANLFYGAKNISQAKLGKVIYIPDFSTTNEAFKLTGPSPFRDLVNFVFQKIVSNSPTFQSFNNIIDKFNTEFMAESTDGISMNDLQEKINEDLKSWEVNFGMKVTQPEPKEIVKLMFSYYLRDKVLDENIEVSSYGHGLQRHLVYTLIKLSSEYVEKAEKGESDSLSDFTLLLFEEPEAFLHPSQQIRLNISLNKLATSGGTQVLISTHSPTFVSKNIKRLTSLLSVKKKKAVSEIFQLKDKDVEELFDENNGLFKKFSEILSRPNIESKLEKEIKGRGLGQESIDDNIKLEEESLKYFMWLDAERAASFFAKHVIICEGATEKVVFEYLMNKTLIDLIDKQIYILDAMGKYNLHRYMNLFGKLGITHSVLYDKDNDKDINTIINDFIESKKNKYTKIILKCDKDFENFLGIKESPRKEKSNRKDLKPLNVIMKLDKSEIPQKNLNELNDLLYKLCEF